LGLWAFVESRCYASFHHLGPDHRAGMPIPKSSLAAAELVRACAESGGESAWGEFLAHFQRPIALSVLRVARKFGVQQPREIVEELLQDVVAKLLADKCARLYQFSLAHPEAVEAYVKALATNQALDFFKSHRSMKRGGGETSQLLDSVEVKADPSSLGGEGTIVQGVLLRQIDDFLIGSVSGDNAARDRTVFWLYYRQGMTAQAIAAIPSNGLSVKGVESLLLRLTRLVRNWQSKRGERRSEGSATNKGIGSLESY
jgi:RNA polymerase sigma-70 factor (ECF subfamily)